MPYDKEIEIGRKDSLFLCARSHSFNDEVMINAKKSELFPK